YPSEMNCTLVITGEEEEVVRAASEHAVSVHGHTDSPELRERSGRLRRTRFRSTPDARGRPAAPDAGRRLRGARASSR
ncbi:DUF1059 domain-containing protein, partial [Streptomyces sp. Isolate_219]|nr:DUF1059 domain-containing protein [Streptomyces sp. Isolate_219]